MQHTIRRSLSIIFGFAAIVFISIIFVTSISKIPPSSISFNYPFLILAFLISPFSTFLNSWLWYQIIILLNEKPKFITVWRANMYATIMRYIPGKIWNYLGKIHWVSKSGISEKKILFSSILELLFIMIGALITSIYSLKIFIPNLSYFYFAGSLFVLLIIIHPKIIELPINFYLRLKRKSTFNLKFNYRQMITLSILYALHWILMGLQFFIFIHSFYPLDPKIIPEFIGINSGSWVIGYLSIIAPGGIGVKEGVFVFALKSFVPVSIAVLCAVLLRIFTIINEVATAGILLCFDRGAWKKLFSKKVT